MKQLQRSIGYDTSHIRIIKGLGDVFEPDDESTESPRDIIPSPANESYHDKIWSSKVNGRSRLLSMGDLKFDLGQRVIAVLPLYINPDHQIQKLAVVVGQIVDVISIPVDDADIPRLINAKHHKPVQEWAQPLVISDCKENSINRCQTIVTEYKLKLDEEFRLTAEMIKRLKEQASTATRVPYDLKFEQSVELMEELNLKRMVDGKKKRSKASKAQEPYDTITVHYRYVMGTETACHKFIKRKHQKAKVDISDIQGMVSKSKLYSGAYIKYLDKADAPPYNFVIIDYFIPEPFDLRFVIRSNAIPHRILAITKLNSFDVRLAYPTDDYWAFHPLERYSYTIVDPPVNDPHLIKSVTTIIEDIFQPFEVYVVKKSLCNASDIESVVCEDNMGGVKIVKTMENSDRRFSESFAGSSMSRLTNNPDLKGLKYSGISITTYVKGLSYPENNPPTEHDGYTFFHSKDYYELDLNETSDNFLKFICTSANHMLFRNPAPKDIILAVPFNCDREVHRDKINLRWFYPTEDFRLLHLYIKSKGQDNIFRPPNNPSNKITSRKPTEGKKDIAARIKYIRNMFRGPHLAIIDLLLYGLAPNNPTINSAFTARFIRHFSLWAF